MGDNLTHGHFVVGEMSRSRDRCVVWHCRVEKWHLVHGVVKTGQQQVSKFHHDNGRHSNFHLQERTCCANAAAVSGGLL